MTTFRYKGRARDGASVSGSLDSGSADAVAGELSALGITPVQITPASERSSPLDELQRWWRMRRISLTDLVMFSRQMHALTRAGVPIIRTLRGLAETSRSAELGEVLSDVASQLEGGHELAGALQRHPRVFSTLFVSVIHVGEAAGQLEESFKRLYEYLELDEETRKRIKGATRYPTLVLGAIAIAIVIVNIFVVPPFAKMFASFGADLPWATKLLINMSHASIEYWPHALAVMAVVLLLARQFVRSESGRLRWDRAKLGLPVVGSILERALLARLCRTLAVTLHAGLPITQSLSVAARAVDNHFVGGRILMMLEEIEHGDTLTNAAHASELFTPLVLQMITVGEETGAVDDMLAEVATYYEQEVDYDLKRIGDSIEPILIVAVGVLVLILALGVYLPMWDLASAARGAG